MLLRIWVGLLVLLPFAGGCTLIAVGKHATKDGSIFVSHTDDAGDGATDLRLVNVPAADHDANATRPVYMFQFGYPRLLAAERSPLYQPKMGEQAFTPIGHIPQVKHTYAYFDQEYATVNEVGLVMGETSCAAKTVGWPRTLPYGHNLFDISELGKVAMERCATARCAIRTMGDLAVEHGFYSNGSNTPQNPGFDDSAEALAIGDRTGEVWMFHILTGPHNRSAIWAAQRVPHNGVVAAPNSFVIRRMDLSDTENFMASHNVKSFAKEMGWWNPKRDGEFDFTAAYAVSDPYPLVPLYVGRRMWRIYDLVAPSLKLNGELGFLPRHNWKTYPFSVKPDKKLVPHDIMRIMRDHFEGTAYDLTKGLAAGPFGNPNRYSGTPRNAKGAWERALSMHRAVYSYVAVSRPTGPARMSAVLWYGHDAPHGTVYVPFFGGQETVPQSYLKSVQSMFDPTGAWWAFNFVNNWVQLAYNVIQPEVQAEQRRLEELGEQLVHDLDRKAKQYNSEEDCMKMVEDEQLIYANQVVVDWWALAHRLVAKYNNGFIVKGEAGSDMGMAVYPEWWLKAVGFDKWPGKTFVQPKVYHNYVPSFKVVGTGPSVPPGTGTLGPVLLGAAGALIVLAIVRASHQPPARRAEYEYLS